MHPRGNGLICLCILTVFICAADAALMRNTFRLILLPHACRNEECSLKQISAAHFQKGLFLVVWLKLISNFNGYSPHDKPVSNAKLIYLTTMEIFI